MRSAAVLRLLRPGLPRPRRTATSLVLAFLLVAALPLLSSVAAQGAPSTSVRLEGPVEGSVHVEEPATFIFNVTNDSEGSGTPFDEQMTSRVFLTVAGMPEGWTAGIEPAEVELPPGASQEVRLTVSATPAAEGVAQMTVSALLRTRLEGLDPVLGQIPGAEQTATDAVSITLGKQQSAARPVLEAIGNWIFVILAALLAAIIISAKLIADNRRVTVSLSSPERRKAVPPGGRAAVPVTVRNIGRGDDTVVFQVSPVRDGWAAFLPVAEMELARGGQEQLHLVVIAPGTAEPGDRQDILITANSAQGPRHPASITVEAYVE